MIPLKLVLRETKASYEVKKGGRKFDHLLFMHDLKLFSKNEDQIDSIVNTVRIVSEDITMEFGFSKSGVLIIKSGRVVKSDKISMPNANMIKNSEEGGYKYLQTLEVYGVNHNEMKGQIKKEYIRRVRNIKSKLNGGNVISAINSRAVSNVRHGAGLISWTKMELEVLDQKTRKLMTKHGAYSP